MQVGVLKTDGGPHSAEMWAGITASQIIQIASSASAGIANAARDFETKLIGLLTRLHGDVQKAERAALDKKGADHMASEINTGSHRAVDAVIALAEGSPFAAHFAKPEVKGYLAKLVHEHFHHSVVVERSWHADKNPDDKASKNFKHQLTHGRLGAYAGDPKGEK